MARQELQVLRGEAVFGAEALPDGRVRLAIEHRHGEAAVAVPAEEARQIALAILGVLVSMVSPEPPPKPKRKPKGGGACP
jgi:hypothetical protein